MCVTLSLQAIFSLCWRERRKRKEGELGGNCARIQLILVILQHAAKKEPVSLVKYSGLEIVTSAAGALVNPTEG
jgi:hypothetical protein